MDLAACMCVYRDANIRISKKERFCEEALARPSPSRPGVQGLAQGPLVGSRGNAPVGVKGAKPPEAPGFLQLKSPLEPF